jgi:hypothetical protein
VSVEEVEEEEEEGSKQGWKRWRMNCTLTKSWSGHWGSH